VKIKALLAVTATFLGLASVGQAGTITINNPSFESPSCGSPGPVSCAPADWTVSGSAGAILPASSDPLQAFDGSQYAYANAGGTLEQTLATALQGDTSYELTIWVGNRANDLGTGFCPGCVFDPTVELLAGTTVLGDASGSTPAVGSWAEWTFTYDASASDPNIGQDFAIELSAAANQGDFDLVGLQTVGPQTAPEPSMLLLAGAGLVGMGLARRRLRG